MSPQSQSRPSSAVPPQPKPSAATPLGFCEQLEEVRRMRQRDWKEYVWRTRSKYTFLLEFECSLTWQQVWRNGLYTVRQVAAGNVQRGLPLAASERTRKASQPVAQYEVLLFFFFFLERTNAANKNVL
jgi:hypothetical protein